MNVEAYISLISSVGFPIVVSGVLFNYMVKTREAHKEEIDKLRQTLENNTKVLVELTTLIKDIKRNEKG